MSLSISGSQITFNDASVQNTAATGFGFKNRIINGSMQIWQRGTSFSLTSTHAYCVDRWLNLGQTGTYSQSSDAPSGFKYSLSIASTSTYYGTVAQRIESQNALDLAGQSVTISFWAKATTGGASGLVVALDYANAVDNFVANTGFASSTTAALTSTWTRYSVTFNSLNANVVNGMQLYIYNAAGGTSAITYLITGVQLEKGSTATSFDYRPYGTELQLCQRYYYRLSAASSLQGVISGWNANSSTAQYFIQFPATMRIAPTAMEQSGTASHYLISAPAGNATCSSVPVYTSASTINATTNWTGTITSGQPSTAYFNNIAAYLGWSAEL